MITTWVSNGIHYKMWNTTTIPFPNLNGMQLLIHFQTSTVMSLILGMWLKLSRNKCRKKDHRKSFSTVLLRIKITLETWWNIIQNVLYKFCIVYVKGFNVPLQLHYSSAYSNFKTSWCVYIYVNLLNEFENTRARLFGALSLLRQCWHTTQKYTLNDIVPVTRCINLKQEKHQTAND